MTQGYNKKILRTALLEAAMVIETLTDRLSDFISGDLIEAGADAAADFRTIARQYDEANDDAGR